MIENLEDGKICLDSNFANQIGFTKKLFTDDSFLWKENDFISFNFVCERENEKFIENIIAICNQIILLGFHIRFPITTYSRMNVVKETPQSKLLKKIAIYNNFTRGNDEWVDFIERFIEIWDYNSSEFISYRE